MYLEQALQENNEFIRLQKIGLGCKAITARVPFLTNFDDPNILKLLFYCYPYSTSTIEMILQCMIDKFQTVEFCDAMFATLIQIGSTKEITRTSLKTQRHSTLKLFTNSVYSNIPQIKLYSLTVLKPMFYLAKRLHLSMEQRTLLFIKYLQNTTNEELISLVLGIFAQLKQQQIFGHTWIMNVEDQIYQCLNGGQQVTQSSVDSFDVMEKSDHNSIDIEEWIITGDTNIETIIGQFTSPAKFNQFMAYIFNPQYYPIADKWKVKYPQVRIPFDSQYYMKYGHRLEKYEILRSTKVLQIIMNYDNFSQLYNTVPHIYSQIFILLQNSFQDTGDINYLHHTASLLDFLINQMPKTSLYFILQLNLLFHIPKLLHNNTIYNILAKLLDIIHDQYNVGNKCNQLLWKYIYHSKWFEFVIQLLQNKDMTEQLSNYVEGQQTLCILAELKQLIAYEKPKLDQIAQQTNQITQETLSNELNSYDIDNLVSLTNQFKKSRTTIKNQIPINLMQKLENSPVKRKSLTQKCVPPIETIFKLVNNDKQLKGSLTPNYQIKLDQVTFHAPSISRTSRITTKVSEQHSTSRDGILSNIGRLYPNYRNSICSSQFEKKSQQYECNVVLAERFSQLVLLQLQIFIINKNSPYKQNFGRNAINTSDFWNSMSNQKTFEYYFQSYLFQLFNEERYEIALQFGSIVNLIVENRHIAQKYLQLNQVCANSMDYLCKQIVKCNIVTKQPNTYLSPNELKQQSQISTIILYLLNTMLLILQMQQDQQMDSMKNIYLHLNETVLHVLMNQFFSSVHNNIFQQKFIKLLSLIFAKAPCQVLLAILFKLGLVPKVYDAMKLLIDNNMLKLRHLDSFYFHLTLIPYIIKQAFDNRNMSILETQLNTLQSWNYIKSLEFIEQSNIHHQIQAEFNIETEMPHSVKPHYQSACQSPVNDVKLNKLLIPTRLKALRKYTNH